jgi:PIN domain nuclease of toxin-antitoxin system
VIVGVADTHAALWYLHRNPRLSVTARTFMDDAAHAGHNIALSPISLAEIVYLVEKNRLPVSAYEELKAALADPEYVIEEAPFTAEVVEALRQVLRAEVPDMPDRIVAATAVYLRVPVISRDGRIRSSTNIQTVW